MDYKFDHPELKLTYKVIEKPSFRDVMAYDSKIDQSVGESLYERLWTAAPELIENWECEDTRLKPGVFPDEDYDEQLWSVIKAVSLEVFSYRQFLREPKKN